MQEHERPGHSNRSGSVLADQTEVTPTDSNVVWLDDAARTIGVTRATLYKWIAKGYLVRIKKPRDRRTYVDLFQAQHLQPRLIVRIDRQLIEQLIDAVKPADEFAPLVSQLRWQLALPVPRLGGTRRLMAS